MDVSKDVVLVTVNHITKTVRGGEDTVLFHFKMHPQTSYIFQITLCKQPYVLFGVPYIQSFSFLLG